MASPYLGDVRAMSFDFVQQGWALCNGQLLSIAENRNLFALLGTTYGGDGLTNFAVPALSAVPAQGGKTLNYCICLNGAYPPQ
jgi:microcystin-dependent protein